MITSFEQRREANRQNRFEREGVGYMVNVLNPKEFNQIFHTNFDESEYYEYDGEKHSSNVIAILANKPFDFEHDKLEELELKDLTLIWIPGDHNKSGNHTWKFNHYLNPDGEKALTREQLKKKLHFYRGNYTFHPALRDDNGNIVKDENGNVMRSQKGITRDQYLIVEVAE